MFHFCFWRFNFYLQFSYLMWFLLYNFFPLFFVLLFFTRFQSLFCLALQGNFLLILKCQRRILQRHYRTEKFIVFPVKPLATGQVQLCRNKRQWEIRNMRRHNSRQTAGNNSFLTRVVSQQVKLHIPVLEARPLLLVHAHIKGVQLRPAHVTLLLH